MSESLQGRARWLLELVWQDGGQRRARRNAWQAMLADRRRASARAEADAAVRDLALETSRAREPALAVR